jgi:hypothetical protein
MKRFITVSMVFALGLLIYTGPASAKKPKSYSLKCAGEDDTGNPAGLSGIMQFTDATDAVGTVFLNIGNGTVTGEYSYTATIVNGTSVADGSTGNNIPKGCFTVTTTISGDNFGLFSNLYGCYSNGGNGFYAVQSSGAQVTCEATAM